MREAVLQCLNQAQKFAACREHTYQSAKGYTNGLIRCIKCGFWGHSTVVNALKAQVSHLTIALEVEKEFNARNETQDERRREDRARSVCGSIRIIGSGFV